MLFNVHAEVQMFKSLTGMTEVVCWQCSHKPLVAETRGYRQEISDCPKHHAHPCCAAATALPHLGQYMPPVH